MKNYGGDILNKRKKMVSNDDNALDSFKRNDRYVVEPIHTLIGGYAWRNSRGGGYEQFVR